MRLSKQSLTPETVISLQWAELITTVKKIIVVAPVLQYGYRSPSGATNDTQHNDIQHNSKNCDTLCNTILGIVKAAYSIQLLMPNVVTQSAAVLGVVRLSTGALCVDMLSIIMLSVAVLSNIMLSVTLRHNMLTLVFC